MGEHDEDMTYTTEPTRAQLAARVAELEAQLAAAMKLLDICLKFFDTLDDEYPPALDYAIRHFKRQVAGEISWDESSDQTLRRELVAAVLRDAHLVQADDAPPDDTDAPLKLAPVEGDDE